MTADQKKDAQQNPAHGLLPSLVKGLSRDHPGRKFFDSCYLDALAHRLELFGPATATINYHTATRSLKSDMVSSCVSAFLLGRDPKERVLCVSMP